MKKLLALILSVVMLLSVMPMAFAIEESLMDAYVGEIIKLYTYYANSYEPQSFKKYIEDNYMTFVMGPDSPADQWYAKNEEEIPAKYERIKEINAEIEGRIADGEATVIVDTSAYLNAYISYICFARDNEETVEKILDYVLDSEFYEIVCIDDYKVMEFIRNGCASQAEFDAVATNPILFYELVVKHALGEHDFGEYISNNDATEEADGTKTATCDFCGTTDTVVDEGTKLETNDDTDNSENDDDIDNSNDDINNSENNDGNKEENLSFFARFFASIKEFFTKILSVFGL